MASGFITMRNGRDWYARWSTYDYLLESIKNELSTEGKEGEVRAWIEYLLPDEEKGDIECGWSFIKGSDGNEMVTRNLDTRLLKEEYLELFWAGLIRFKERTTDPDLKYLALQVYNAYKNSLQEDYTLPDANKFEELEDYQVGPGWTAEESKLYLKSKINEPQKAEMPTDEGTSHALVVYMLIIVTILILLVLIYL